MFKTIPVSKILQARKSENENEQQNISIAIKALKPATSPNLPVTYDVYLMDS